MKKIIPLILTFMLIFLSIPAFAVSSSDADKIADEADKTNQKIMELVNTAVEKSCDIIAKYDLEASVSQKTYDKMQSIIQEEIDKLIERTDKEVLKLDIKAEKYNVTIEHEYIYVTIGDQVIEIDPMRVIGI